MRAVDATRPGNDDWRSMIRPPALAPHFFADGAGNARLSRGKARAQRFLRHFPRDFQKQLSPNRFDELLASACGHHEGAGPADHAVAVVVVEVGNIEKARLRFLDRKS